MNNNRNMFLRVPEFGDMELRKASFRNHAFSPHFHEEYSIGVFLKGSQAKFYRRSSHIISEGEICLLNPTEVHYGKAVDQYGWTYRMLYPNVELVKRVASQITGKEKDYPFFKDLVVKDNKLYSMIDNLHKTLEASEVSLLEKESKFLLVMEQLILKYSDDPPKNFSLKSSNKHIRTVKDYINENYYQDISLEMLSEVADLSPYYLLRLFKREVGATPHVYLTQRRIEKAKQFLNSGEPLTKVAYKTGFVDQSHFTNRFRNIVGITPGRYISEISL